MEDEESMETGMAVVLILVFMVSLFMWQEVEKKADRKKRREQRKDEFGKDPRELPRAGKSRDLLEEIGIYLEETRDGLPQTAVDEVTWNDLEMDEVFLRINHTRSYIGEQVLYRSLHAVGENGKCGKGEKTEKWSKEGCLKNGSEKWEEHLAYFRENEADREELEEALWRIGKEREDYYLPMFLKNAACLTVEHLWVYRILQFLLFGGAVAAIFLQNPYFLVISGVTALVNVAVYAVGKEKYEAYLYALGSVKQLILFQKLLCGKTEWRKRFVTKEQEDALRDLEGLARTIGRYQGKKMGAWSGDVFDLFRDYVIGATLWDITTFGRIVRMIEGKQESLFLLYETAGKIDMEIAVTSFRESLTEYCIPVQEGETLRAKQLYHPLLAHPVRNDFIQAGCCLVTGANATGKSTFIKAIAINAILAQTIHTCTASEFAMPDMRVLTSMAVRDDLLAGQSYYIREVGYLKRIVDAAGERDEMPVLCVIDEILRGTNTGERIAASEAVCRYLAGKNCQAIVATHDMELTKRLAEEYRCYHFKSEIKDGDIVFDYKIYDGCGNNRNAIELLAVMGFPGEIVWQAAAAVDGAG